MIYQSWDEIPSVGAELHDSKFLDILKKHGFEAIKLVVPLKGRYTKPRRWEEAELEQIIMAWREKVSITLLAACLNRNPQDMIYKLLKYCKSRGIAFSQKERSENSKNWNEQVRACALDLFESGLPAWKIAVLFQVDFEHVEKEMFIKREHYGHDKKNPFGINTDHKQLVNRDFVRASDIRISRAFEPFCGEGRFTKVLLDCDGIKDIVCIENNAETLVNFKKYISDSRVRLIEGDNLNYFRDDAIGKFDLIDLDPFISCCEQLNLVWAKLNDESLLCVTFGGEYRRSFIQTNRKSIARKYGFSNSELDNKKYLEIVPSFFIGHVAKLASDNCFSFKIVRAVRYANNCRFWLRVTRDTLTSCRKWFSSQTENLYGGALYKDLVMPRFREVRSEIDKERSL